MQDISYWNTSRRYCVKPKCYCYNKCKKEFKFTEFQQKIIVLYKSTYTTLLKIVYVNLVNITNIPLLSIDRGNIE